MIHALAGQMRQYFLWTWRYRMALFWNVVFGWTIFALLFFGIKVSAGAGLGATTASLIVGYWVWQMAGSAFDGVGGYISGEASVGTLEQLYLSPYPFWWVLLGRVLGIFLHDLAFYVPFLFLLMLTTGRWLDFAPVSVLSLLVPIVAQAYGIGLVIAGVALIHKRVQVLDQVFIMLFAVSIATPQDASPLSRFLPFNLEWRLLRDVMAEGIRLWEVPVYDLAFVALKTVALIWAGWTVYSFCERIARRRALLGQY